MEPFFFGNEHESLFGVYHPPAKVTSCDDIAVVLCYPFGQEYMRSHRAFLTLARLLCSAGFHVMRFDYYGCGDSTGDSESGTIEHWITDISTTINEVKNGSGAKHICLIGLRLGASLAALSGIERGDIDAMVLWNPIISGSIYLLEMNDMHEQWLRGSFAKTQLDCEDNRKQEVLGFAITDSIARRIEEINLIQLTQKPAQKVLVIESGPTCQCEDLVCRLKQINVTTNQSHVPDAEAWLNMSNSNKKGLVPMQALQNIIGWLSGVYV